MILPEADAILTGDDSPRINIRKATFVTVADGLAQVDMGDSRFVCDFGTGYIPRVGETVRIWSVGNQHLLFPSGPRPAVGTVLTVDGDLAKVETTTGLVTCAYVGNAPASGDRVGIVWSEDGPWCTQPLSNTPDAPDPVPDPGGGGSVRSATFFATGSGSTDRGQARWWTDQPRAGNSTYGAWFYGTQIKDTIPAGSALVSMEFYAAWWQRSGDAPNFGLHADGHKAGVPNVVGAAPWVPVEGWNLMPYAVDWFPQLIAGGGQAGVGLNQGGNNIFASLVQNGMSGALRIHWRS